MTLGIFDLDPALKDVQGQIWDRVNGYKHWKAELEKSEGGMAKFAEGYKIFGFTRSQGGWTYREWLPEVKQVFLTGEFNGWTNETPCKTEGFGKWSVFIPDKADGSPGIPHGSVVKVRMESNDGSWNERVPAWIKRAVQDPKTFLFNGVFWEPPEKDKYVFKFARPSKPAPLKVYEAHVGMGSIHPRVASYTEFARDVLPRINALGYNCVQLMAVAEHAHYGSFGYHVTNFFAPSSRQGTPEELKLLVDTAHGLGISVLIDLVHAHASANTLDGLAQMDGTDYCYTHGGAKGHHSEWDSKIFHVTKHEVLRFLLSNVKWWLEEYKFDGFRFDGITSMLYQSHGIGKGYTGGYHEYFGPDADIESHIYLMLANDLIHSIVPSAITVGEDVSGMPTLCRPVEEGGFGFDYRLAMAIPDLFIKYLKEMPDDGWGMGHLTHTLTNRRYKENVIAYSESHDQAIVGDKTLAFWLMDAEMYTGMSLVQNPQHSMCVDRGLALHKMIRLLVLGLGGEGYLNFMGNEFGHPEWIDFPTEKNGGSYQHCRRRWDLADDDLLRYKFFQSFDELMQATENRFNWLTSDNQYVSTKNEGDKVIAFERGDLLFVFNLHPCQSFSDYGIGMAFNEPMRTILDTDEGRFGGHTRLEWGHGNSFPVGPAMHGRPHSVTMYLPSRTAQVLCKESAIKGGVKIHLDPDFLKAAGLEGKKISMLLVEGEDSTSTKNKLGEHKTQSLEFKDNSIQLEHSYAATFMLQADGKNVPCQSSGLGKAEGYYRCYFPGDYQITGSGWLRNGKPGVAAAAAASKPVAVATSGSTGYTAARAPKAPMP